MTIRPRRSVLYMPGSNARALEKGKTLAADVLMFELEDGVAESAKSMARQQVADAERLPYRDDSFDVVTSCVGVMFAPHHAQAADELVRVCRPDGRIGLINSGGESKGASDLAEAVATAVVNKRAGGMGLISGRKAFQKPMKEGVALLNAIQDVYLETRVTVA